MSDLKKKQTMAERMLEKRQLQGLDSKTPVTQRLEQLTSANAQHHVSRADRTLTRTQNTFDVDPQSIRMDRGNYRTTSTLEDDASLAESIRKQGVMTPLWVRQIEVDGKLQLDLIAGWRRLRAAVSVGLATVPVQNWGVLTDAEADGLQLLENEQRRKPHILDTAFRFLDMHRRHDWSQDRVAYEMGRSKATVSILMRAARLVELLPLNEQKEMRVKKISFRGLREIVGAALDESGKLERMKTLFANVSAGDLEEEDEEDEVELGPTAKRRSQRANGKGSGAVMAPFFSAQVSKRGARYAVRWTLARTQEAPINALSDALNGVRQLAKGLAERFEGSGVGKSLGREEATAYEAQLELLRRIAKG